MGIVKLSDQMHENLRLASAALSRSVNAQAEHWMRIGMLAELHPQLTHAQICQRLIQAELQGGLDLADMAARLAPAPAAPVTAPVTAQATAQASSQARTTRRMQ